MSGELRSRLGSFTDSLVKGRLQTRAMLTRLLELLHLRRRPIISRLTPADRAHVCEEVDKATEQLRARE